METESADCRQTVGGMSADSRRTVYRQSAVSPNTSTHANLRQNFCLLSPCFPFERETENTVFCLQKHRNLSADSRQTVCGQSADILETNCNTLETVGRQCFRRQIAKCGLGLSNLVLQYFIAQLRG